LSRNQLSLLNIGPDNTIKFLRTGLVAAHRLSNLPFRTGQETFVLQENALSNPQIAAQHQLRFDRGSSQE
jgi:hypothetical protein